MNKKLESARICCITKIGGDGRVRKGKKGSRVPSATRARFVSKQDVSNAVAPEAKDSSRGYLMVW
jgi:hypothetical protein